MDPHQGWPGMNVAHDQGNSFFGLAIICGFQAEAVDAELSPARRKIGAGKLFGGRRAHSSIIGAAVRNSVLPACVTLHSPTREDFYEDETRDKSANMSGKGNSPRLMMG